jgi:hypothetical protein
MKNQKLKELIDKLIREIRIEEGKPFHYELCPHFYDCGIALAKECLSIEYKECIYYQHHQGLLK